MQALKLDVERLGGAVEMKPSVPKHIHSEDHLAHFGLKRMFRHDRGRPHHSLAFAYLKADPHAVRGKLSGIPIQRSSPYDAPGEQAHRLDKPSIHARTRGAGVDHRHRVPLRRIV
jgi:hypothetical protein